MKIISLQAENFKKLVAIRIDPKGNMVQLTGKNAQGKTSVLDAIFMALKVTGLDQNKPVRDGQETGRIRLDLGELIVTRKFRVKEDGETTTSIVVTAADGAKYDSPQGMLDGLLSSLTFDPLEFSRMVPAAQVKAVRSLLPGVDFDAVTAANKADFDARTEVNRRVRDLQVEVTALGDMPANVPERVDKTALVTALTAASETNAGIEKRRANRETVKEAIQTAKDRIVELQAELATQEALVTKKQAKLDAAPELPALVDATALGEQVNAADATNAIVDRVGRLKTKMADLAKAKADAEALTKSMDGRLAALQAQINEAKLPVAGMTFSDDTILLNGIPFNQASDAEQLRTSIAIAMSLNPKLRVIRVRDGSLLDEEGLAILESMANEKDFQVWIERVDSSGKVGFVLENGHLKGQEIEAEAPAETPKKAKATKAKPEAAPVAPVAAPAPATAVSEPSQDELL